MENVLRYIPASQQEEIKPELKVSWPKKHIRSSSMSKSPVLRQNIGLQLQRESGSGHPLCEHDLPTRLTEPRPLDPEPTGSRLTCCPSRAVVLYCQSENDSEWANLGKPFSIFVT
jgi:hypothetical protein